MLSDKISKYNVYLASQSSRRQELLQRLDINFNIALKVAVNENYDPALEKEEIAMYIAEKKAEAYDKLIKKNRLLITADTIVWIENQVLGKPQNTKEAFDMLKKLSGKMHSVITGITIQTAWKKHTFYCETKVWFKELSSEEINFYIKNYKPFDKAGAYGIQEWIGLIGVKNIEGSYNNVVGLPLYKLYNELNNFLD